MNVAFIYAGASPIDAVSLWVKAIARFSVRHDVLLVKHVNESLDADYVFPIPHGEVYNTGAIDEDMGVLRKAGKKFGIIHNYDNPPVPTPGNYCSFAWTHLAMRRLEVYGPVLVRQPVFPQLVEPRERLLHLGTFGHVEPKKETFKIARWARKMRLPFTVFAPSALAGLYSDYIDSVRRCGAKVVVHQWHERIEDLADLMDDVSHFIFSLGPSKLGTGGSPTSVRYATMFGRPVIAVDDEDLLCFDNIYTYRSLDDIDRDQLGRMVSPRCDRGPDEYIDELIAGVQSLQ